MNKLISLESFFLKRIVPVVLFVSVGFSSFFVIRDYEANKKSRLESQNVVLDTFISSIRQPLMQGSYVEAQIRGTELTLNKQVYCVEITVDNETIFPCRNDILKSGLSRLDSDIHFDGLNSPKLGHVAVFFDNSDLIKNSWKKVSETVGGFIFLSLLFFFALKFEFSKIKEEVYNLIEVASSEAQTKDYVPKFQIKEIHSLYLKLKHYFEMNKSIAEAKAKEQIVRQVSHDIRSPLSMIFGLTHSLPSIDSSDKLLITSGLERIQAIVKDLEYKKSNYNKDISDKRQESYTGLLSITEEIVREKQATFKSLNIEFIFSEESHYCFSSIAKHDYQRMISNLINNSAEAVGVRGFIRVELNLKDGFSEIKIKDNGKGIPSGLLSKVTQKGFSYNKDGGSGLGLHHAKSLVDQVNGRLLIESKVGHGTQITLLLPLESQPNWVPKTLPLSSFKRIALIDDQRLNLELIKYTLKEYLINTKIEFFSSCEEFLSQTKSKELELDWILVDYDLGQGKLNGLEFIQNHGYKDKAILVTNHFVDLTRDKNSTSLGIQIANKTLAGVSIS